MENNTANKSNSNGNKKIEGLIIGEYDLYVEVKKKNKEYKKGGLVFPSYELYSVLKNINKGLSLLYTKTGEECDYEPIFDSKYRRDHFDKNCLIINHYIYLFEEIKEKDPRVSEFLHNNRLSSKFSSLFDSIYNAFMEAMQSRNNFDNEIKRMQNKEIKKIVKDLAYNGIDPFSPHMI